MERSGSRKDCAPVQSSSRVEIQCSRVEIQCSRVEIKCSEVGIHCNRIEIQCSSVEIQCSIVKIQLSRVKIQCSIKEIQFSSVARCGGGTICSAVERCRPIKDPATDPSIAPLSTWLPIQLGRAEIQFSIVEIQ